MGLKSIKRVKSVLVTFDDGTVEQHHLSTPGLFTIRTNTWTESDPRTGEWTEYEIAWSSREKGDGA